MEVGEVDRRQGDNKMEVLRDQALLSEIKNESDDFCVSGCKERDQ